MQWIEHLFGTNPDNGNGTVEATVVLASLLLVVASVQVLGSRVRVVLRARRERLRARGRR